MTRPSQADQLIVSAGRLAEQPGDQVLVRDRPDQHVYPRLVVAGGRVVGAVILGTPDEAPALLAAVEQEIPVVELAAVRAGGFQPARSADGVRPR